MKNWQRYRDNKKKMKMRQQIIDAYQDATAVANKKVPEYEVNTPEHDQWLKAFDEAYAAAILKQERGH